MSFEKMQPAPKVSPEETGEQQEKNKNEFLQSFAKSKVGKYLSLFGVGLAGLIAVEQANAGEWKGVLTEGGKARIEKIKNQRAKNIAEARNEAVKKFDIAECNIEKLPDGRVLYQIKTNEGVEINAIDPKEFRGDAEAVGGPGAVEGPHKAGVPGAVDSKMSGSKFFSSGFKW